MDLFARKIVAWQIGSKATATLVVDTTNQAFKCRNRPKGLMFHSDQGAQYTSKTTRKLLDELNIVQSFSKKGHPYDNACMECFFRFLKSKKTNRRTYANLTELNTAVFAYIESFYNKSEVIRII